MFVKSHAAAHETPLESGPPAPSRPRARPFTARAVSAIRSYPLLRRYGPLVREDLSSTYERNLHRWLLISPLVGILVGLLISLVAGLIMHVMWPRVFDFYLRHPWTMLFGITAGGAIAGLLMQFGTPNPNEHSTEEVIRSYHEHDGAIDTRWLVPKLLAAAATVGSGGSGALEGPSIYGGASVGSWLWLRLRRIKSLALTERDRRILLICGAAAGMSAVFRAPLTGIVFALEMPYKDDLAHEALLPSLIASVVSYLTLGSLLGSESLFDFRSSATYTMRDLLWSGVLGLIIGMVALVFVITFRRLRRVVLEWDAPHWTKVALGGFFTAVCGIVFLQIYPGRLLPIGPNYEAVSVILDQHHPTSELLAFAFAKLAATAFTLGGGGVTAMFIPLFLTGGDLGVAFAQSGIHSPAVDLYAAVGMASFIAAAYKTPLAAVVFVAEATGGHSFIIPALVGAAAAYTISGDASTSADQRISETAGTRSEAEPRTQLF